MFISDNRIHRVCSPRRPPMKAGEMLLIFLASLWFVLATWWLGAVHSKPQLYLLLISGVTLLTAILIPYGHEFPKSERFRRLMRFPVFWLGLVLLIYMAVQWANPEAMMFEFDGKRGLVTKDLRGVTEEQVKNMSVGEFQQIPELKPIKWLPTSVHAPFELRNPSRVMVLWASVWLLVCALWVGITRRRSLHTLLLVVVANALLFAFVAIFQIFNHSDKILGIYESPIHTFVGTFINRGLGAAFMNCGIVISLGMFFHYGKVKKSAEASGFTLVYMIAALVMTIGVLVSSSRMGILCCGVFWAIFLLVFIHDWIKQRWTSPAKLGTCILGAATITIVLTIFGTDNLQRSLNRFQNMNDVSIEGRMAQNKSTWQMIKDRPFVGWGAGSYRWVFPTYQKENPQLKSANPRRAMQFTHAHNDILQPVAELGILGVLPLVAILFYWLAQTLRSYRYLDWGLILMTLGSFVLLIHAFTDPLFHSAAIMGMWGLALLAPTFAARLMRTRTLGVNLEE